MAIRVPSPAQAAEKWATVTPGRQSFYSQGVQSAGQAYQEGVSNAGDRYAQGVQEAISANQWSKGVEGKGAKYVRKATAVGAGRWAQGVPAARSDYEAGMQGPLQVLQGITLSPKGPKGSPQNYQRSTDVGTALHAFKRR